MYPTSHPPIPLSINMLQLPPPHTYPPWAALYIYYRHSPGWIVLDVLTCHFRAMANNVIPVSMIWLPSPPLSCTRIPTMNMRAPTAIMIPEGSVNGLMVLPLLPVISSSVEPQQQCCKYNHSTKCPPYPAKCPPYPCHDVTS